MGVGGAAGAAGGATSGTVFGHFLRYSLEISYLADGGLPTDDGSLLLLVGYHCFGGDCWHSSWVRRWVVVLVVAKAHTSVQIGRVQRGGGGGTHGKYS